LTASNLGFFGLYIIVFNKNGTRKYTFLVIGKRDTNFVRHHSDSLIYKYSDANITGILDFPVDNVYVVSGDYALPLRVFHSKVNY
jgi:hypothetical protein